MTLGGLRRASWILRAAVVFGVACAFAAGPPTIEKETLERLERQREDRAPEVARLKALGVAGENRDGRLEILRGEAPAAPRMRVEIQRLVRAENADRDAWIEAAARAAGRPERDVRREFAARLRAGSLPGEWIQEPDASWRRR